MTNISGPSPLRHDNVTNPCPACGRPFVAIGRQRWCSQACRAAGYRQRKQAATPPIVLPDPRPRRPFTVYECDTCGARAVGQQRCEAARSCARSALAATASTATSRWP